jgi:hypothetical protein
MLAASKSQDHSSLIGFHSGLDWIEFFGLLVYRGYIVLFDLVYGA